MKVFAELPKGRGLVVRVSRDRYQQHELVDIRTFYETRPGDPDTRRPTPKGVSLSVRRLPELIAALQAAEAEARAAGLLPDLPRTKAAA